MSDIKNNPIAGAGSSPWTEHGLTEWEYGRIREIMGREPNGLELALFGVMWSEHCSYKNSRPVLKKLPTAGPRVVQGPGENAGAIRVDENHTVVFKIESHNHPSAIEPYQGAATGVGGIVRDVFTMGARPIAVLDSLRFGEPDDERVKHLFAGVVAGIGGYANSLGIANAGGEVYFEDAYDGNPLVNAMCVGILEGPIAKGLASGPGNPVLAVGARTGRDGIKGASFASEELNEKSEERRPSVQVGDPFMEKLLLEATLELLATGAVVGIQDMGAAGLISSSCEMASRAGTGLEIDVLKVPRREQGMTPYEVLLSESQERMLAVIEKGHEDKARRIFEKWRLQATVIGHVTGDGMIRIKEGDAVCAEVPARALAHDAPVYHRQGIEPGYLAFTRAFAPSSLPQPSDLNGVLEKLLASPNLASREWVYRQYDHMVRLSNIIFPGGDASLLRLWGTAKGIALSTDGNGRHVYLDPYVGGAAAVAEAARNCVCVGAEPAAITNCLNFGSPEKPDIFWQLDRAVEGMAEACRVLETPVTGGNVSLYNETNGQAIYPTPTVGMVGIIDDIEKRCTMGFKKAGEAIVLFGDLGGHPRDLGGSEYLKIIHGQVAGRLPRLDLDREKAVQRAALQAIRDGLVSAAHDCADGGLAVALCEMAFAGNEGARGFKIETSCRWRADALLFGEAFSRIILAASRSSLKALREIARRYDVSMTVLGEVTPDRASVTLAFPETRPEATELLRRETVISRPTAELEKAWREAIPCLMS